MEKTWYLHYEEDGKPAGFSQEAPTDIASIPITVEEKEQIEQDPLRYLVLGGSICRIPMQTAGAGEYFVLRMAKSPKAGDWSLSTDTHSILMALTGVQTGKDFYIRIVTERGLRIILVPSSKRDLIMSVYHDWLANNNLK